MLFFKIFNIFSASFGAFNKKFNITLLENQHHTSVFSKSMLTLDLCKVLCWFSGGVMFKYPFKDWKMTEK